MAVQPVKDALQGICNEHDSQIAFNSCHILSKLVAELSAEAMGINVCNYFLILYLHRG